MLQIYLGLKVSSLFFVVNLTALWTFFKFHCNYTQYQQYFLVSHCIVSLSGFPQEQL